MSHAFTPGSYPYHRINRGNEHDCDKFLRDVKCRICGRNGGYKFLMATDEPRPFMVACHDCFSKIWSGEN